MFIFKFFLVEVPSIKYVRRAVVGMVGHPKCVELRTGGGGVTPYVYVRTYTISFHVFGSMFLL